MRKFKELKIQKITADEITKLLISKGYERFELYNNCGVGNDITDEVILVQDSERTIRIIIEEGYKYVDMSGLTEEEFLELEYSYYAASLGMTREEYEKWEKDYYGYHFSHSF